MKTKAIILVLVLFAVSCLLSAVCCFAAVPSLINYQGVLKDSTGVPYDGNATMVFSIWDDSTYGNTLWEETQAIVSVSHGLFNVLLGSSIAIPESVFAQPNSWLQVIANGSQLSPRRRIVSVGYALHSEFTDTAEYALSAPPDDDWDIDTAGFNIYHLTGNVGIGTFPQHKLDVMGTAQMTGFKMLTGASDGYVLTSDSSGGGTWQAAPAGIGGSGTANYIPKFTAPTTIGNSNINETAGNVGIGTTDPRGYKLNVVGSGVSQIASFVSGPSVLKDRGVAIKTDTIGNAYIAAIRGSDEAEGSQLSINPNGGYVGIGTMSPAYKLDVEGYVQAYGYYTGDIIFQKDKEKLWRMFEDEDGLYLENLRTGKIYRFVLQEVEKE